MFSVYVRVSNADLLLRTRLFRRVTYCRISLMMIISSNRPLSQLRSFDDIALYTFQKQFNVTLFFSDGATSERVILGE